MTFYSPALRKNGHDSFKSIASLLSLACLEDSVNEWGLQENIFHILLDKGYSREDAAHDSRYLFLLVKRGFLSTTDTRRQYTYVDSRLVIPV